jgi:hypothetical protein
VEVSKKLIGKERKGKEREGKGMEWMEAMHKSHKSVIFHVVMGRNPWRDLNEYLDYLFIWSAVINCAEV